MLCDDEVAAEPAGVDVARYRMYAAVVGSAMIGPGGVDAYSLGFISPATYVFAGVDVQVLTRGVRRLGDAAGAVIGAAAFGFLDRALADSGELRQAYYAASADPRLLPRPPAGVVLFLPPLGCSTERRPASLGSVHG